MSGAPPRLDLGLPSGKPFDVVGVGVNVVNHLLVLPRFPEPDTKVSAVAETRQGGGVVATALVACARLGLRAKYIGKVGDDDLGRESREGLDKEGIDLAGLVVDPGPGTRFTIGLIEAGSGQRTLIRGAGRPATLQPDEITPAAVTAGRILHLDGYEGLAAVAAARWARTAGVPVSLDAEDATLSLDELLPLTDVLVVAQRFGRRLTGIADPAAILERLAGLGPSLVGVTLGAAGSLARYRGATVHAPGLPVEVADTTGAGDAFHGAVLAGLVWGWPLRDTLRLANTVAALKCRQLGGRAGLPSLTEVRAVLARAGVALPAVPDRTAPPGTARST